MSKEAAFILAILLVAFPAANTLAEVSPKYVLVDLDANSSPSQAYSVNNNGQIVGGALFPSIGHRATLFDSTGNGNNINLGTLGGYDSEAHSINNNGQIVGYSDTVSVDRRATLFDATGEGNNVNLGSLPGEAESIAYSIGNNGQIVGWTVDHSVATLFDPNGSGNNTNLGALGGQYSSAHSINDKGQIVGGAMTASGAEHAAIFDSNGTGNNIDLGTLGGQYSSAHSINDKGRIAGWAMTASGVQHAAIFDSNGTGNNIDLGILPPDYSQSYALSINNNGQIVGVACDPNTMCQDERAVLFDSTGGGNNVDLNTLIDPALGWTLTKAYCINDNGWIVGVGINSIGQEHAYLLKPVRCATPLQGDLNNDCKVNFMDFVIMSGNWLGCNLDPPEACQ